MTKGLVFERHLPHQVNAVESIIKVFAGLSSKKDASIHANFTNPIIDYQESLSTYTKNIKHIQEENNIAFNVQPTFSNIIDVMMETGTGKTYTYTKAMFELNKHYDIFKFIIVVPTLSIKAGTKNFLKSESAREHFKEEYDKTITLHVVESKKRKKNKKTYMPSAISEFVRADKNDKNTIHVLLINAGMLNSSTLQQNFDKTLLDHYTNPIDAITATKPFIILDEPHKFAKENKTWENIKALQPQFIIRFGATFKEYENLIYTLTAVDAFNQNLVKGVIAYIEEFEQGKNVFVRLVNTDGNEATFELVDDKTKTKFKLTKKDSLKKIHVNLTSLSIEKLNKTEVVLSNGLSLKKGDKINPFSYAETLQERMIRKAVKNHFELERKLMTMKPRIKPLTLFFIDNIDEYRNNDGYLRKTLEQTVTSIAIEYKKEETDEFYKDYLEKTIRDVGLVHGGYFSKDNIEKDEKIEKEINEILHDKESLLDLNNPRRFIFSKWTLKEGWDNPNVFQICKLRSSGSEISKLQEVGRGLRLPVNEYMTRVKEKQFYLNYYVDFTESDFVEKLIHEINEKSRAISREVVPEKLNETMIQKILEHYHDKFKTEEELLTALDEANVITRSNKFKEGGFEYIKQVFPLIFDGVDSRKVRYASSNTKKVKVRASKYNELKELWEELNQKAILEYKIKNEDEFKNLFREFMIAFINTVKQENIKDKKVEVRIDDGLAVSNEEYLTSNMNTNMIPVVTMTYHAFLKELAKVIRANPVTLHEVFKGVMQNFDINKYLNRTTIRALKQGFDTFMFYKSIDAFGIAYQKLTHTVHPTKLTSENGDPLNEIDASDIGVFYSDNKPARNYYFEDLFYDSKLEKENIQTSIEEVIVFTKIPKNSIRIPLAGGGTYTPDFAYVLKMKNGEKRLYFVVETKGVESKDELRRMETQKIKHAQLFFGNKITFKTQFSNTKIIQLIQEILTR